MLDPASNNSNSASSSQVLIGIVLVLAGSALNSCQGVLEEKLMKGLGDDVEAHPLQVVGWEGVFGCMWSAFVMLPIVQAMSGSDCGSVENTLDTLKMMHNSPVVVGTCRAAPPPHVFPPPHLSRSRMYCMCVVLVIFYAIALAFSTSPPPLATTA
jgi:hypothetical protein